MKSFSKSTNGLSLYKGDLEIDLSKRRFFIALAVAPCLTLLSLKSTPSLAAKEILLEYKIENYIKRLRRQGMIHPEEKTAWSVYDFRTEKKFVSINENIPYQSASMIKPFVALAFFIKVEQDELAYDQKVRMMMEAMIQRSSNRATNYFIDMLCHRNHRRKANEVEEILKSYAPGIFKHTTIVERIPTNGRAYRNKASARDYSRFLYAVWNDQLPYSQEIKRLMNLPNRDRIFTSRLPSHTEIYDKTGTTAKLCGNMGIVVVKDKAGRDYPYTFIGIIERAQRSRGYTQWKASRSRVIRNVSNMVYDDLKKIHGLI